MGLARTATRGATPFDRGRLRLYKSTRFLKKGCRRLYCEAYAMALAKPAANDAVYSFAV